jgi:hypothetical protein
MLLVSWIYTVLSPASRVHMLLVGWPDKIIGFFDFLYGKYYYLIVFSQSMFIGDLMLRPEGRL